MVAGLRPTIGVELNVPVLLSFTAAGADRLRLRAGRSSLIAVQQVVHEVSWCPKRRAIATGTPASQPCATRLDQARSKRSRFMTFIQAATKSFTNFSCESEQA